MKTYRCNVCETEFTVLGLLIGQGITCPHCGSQDVSPVEGAKASPAASQEATDGKDELPAVREILRRLCRDTYEATFQGKEWDRLIDAAMIELLSILKNRTAADHSAERG